MSKLLAGLMVVDAKCGVGDAVGELKCDVGDAVGGFNVGLVSLKKDSCSLSTS